jgi:hypothetical protein
MRSWPTAGSRGALATGRADHETRRTPVTEDGSYAGEMAAERHRCRRTTRTAAAERPERRTIGAAAVKRDTPAKPPNDRDTPTDAERVDRLRDANDERATVACRTNAANANRDECREN